MDDEVLTIHESWPGTTIDGEPGLVSGVLTVSRAAGGEFLLNVAVGPHSGTPEECDFVEFPLSAGHAAALRDALGLAAGTFPAEPAGPVAADRGAVAGQHLQFDAVHAQRAECPGQDQPGDLLAKSLAAQAGYEQTHRVCGAVLIGVHTQPCAADAARLVLDRPRVTAGQ
jgi:hypothetical protein